MPNGLNLSCSSIAGIIHGEAMWTVTILLSDTSHVQGKNRLEVIHRVRMEQQVFHPVGFPWPFLWRRYNRTILFLPRRTPEQDERALFATRANIIRRFHERF